MRGALGVMFLARVGGAIRPPAPSPGGPSVVPETAPPAEAKADAPRRPPYLQLRYDEDYSFLKDPARRTDFLDPLKYIPLNASGEFYLGFGGEARERYEYFHNSLWGQG